MINRRTIVAFLILTMSFSAFASVKYYRSTTDIPMIEMMVNMMVAMGMLDRVPVGGYGAYPASFGSPYSSWGNNNRSPWGTSPWGASPYAGSPFGGSPYGGSPWGGSPFGGSPYGGSPWGGSPFGGSPYGGSPWGGSPFGGSSYGGSPWGGSPFGGSPYAGSPWGGSPYGASPWGGSPWGGSPYRGRGARWGGSPWGGSPYGASPWGGPPRGGSPYRGRGAQWGGSPWGVSPFSAGPRGPGYTSRYASRYARPYPYKNRWGRRLPAAAYANRGRYPVGAYPRRISDPLFAESGFCPSGLCNRLQAKKALEGVWKNESGETLTIKDNRFDWSDGGERKLSGEMHATKKELVASVDNYDQEIRYRYTVKHNELITRDDKGMTRVFQREPEYEGEKL